MGRRHRVESTQSHAWRGNIRGDRVPCYPWWVESHASFATAIGPCTLAWTPTGIVRLRLLDESPSDAPATPAPAWVKDAMRRIVAHLAGALDPLTDLPLDLSRVSPFARRIYAALRACPPGATVSYGELARQAGSPAAARAVGRAMATNPIPIVIPCHRVLAAGGRPGGFSAPGALTTKARMLAIEGVELSGG